MHQMIFVNLPVTDLDVCRRFWSGLGYSFNETFCDERALCLVLGDRMHAMLLKREVFATFTPREVTDAWKACEVLTGLDAPDRGAVDRIVDRALELGGRQTREPQSMGEVMYFRTFADPDGHQWEIMWMDPKAAEEGCQT